MITKEQVEVFMRGCDLMAKKNVEQLLKERDELQEELKRWQDSACRLEKENLHLKNEYSDDEIDLWHKAIKERDEALEALNDIENFHDKKFEELEKRWGFLGWTCCGQKRAIAKSAQKIMAGRGGEK